MKTLNKIGYLCIVVGIIYFIYSIIFQGEFIKSFMILLLYIALGTILASLKYIIDRIEDVERFIMNKKRWKIKKSYIIRVAKNVRLFELLLSHSLRVLLYLLKIKGYKDNRIFI